jgi:hypothetical protein
LIYDDLTKSPTWAAIEDVLMTLRQYPEAKLTVSVMGTVIEYSRRPFSASPDAVSIEGPASAASSASSPDANVLDLRLT